MKKHTLFWLALSLLTATSHCLAVHYTGDADYNEKMIVVVVSNHLEQKVSAQLKEAPGTLAHVLRPGSSHTWTIKRRSQLTVIGEVYEEDGWSSQKVLAEFDRNGWLADTISISITEQGIGGQVLQRGYITNYMPWAARFEEVRNVHIGVLQPGQRSKLLDFPPGRISLVATFVAGPHAGREFTDYLDINNNPRDTDWFDGQVWRKIGWHFPVDENGKHNDWRRRRH